MSTLGPGVPVWIGWTPDDWCQTGKPRGRYGVIIDGPFEPGEYLPEYGRVLTPMRSWEVEPDGCDLVLISERLLFPIDDGEASDVRERDRELADA